MDTELQPPRMVTDIPDRLLRRPRSRRGYPIPFVQATNPDGTPDFAAINPNLALECAEKHLCGLCGEMLEYWIAFIGGPRSCEHRAFGDPPMHIDCAEA